MFEILFSPKKARRHPFEMFVIAFFYSSISILIASWILPDYTSLVSLFLTLTSTLYVTQGILKNDSYREEHFNEREILKGHVRTLKLFMFFFLGVVLSYAIFAYILPASLSTNLFEVQTNIFQGLKGQVTGNAIDSQGTLSMIIQNNLRVLFISLVISLIYGAGSVFILVWNASILGFVIGAVAKSYGFFSFPAVFLKYFLHGLPEMLSYFMAVLAGGIVYVSVMKGDFKKSFINTKRFFLDIALLIFLSVILMIIAALIEVYISPLI